MNSTKANTDKRIPRLQTTTEKGINRFLSDVASHMAKSTSSDHCSIFLADGSDKIILRATTASYFAKHIGEISYSIGSSGEGKTGLVFSQRTPLVMNSSDWSEQKSNITELPPRDYPNFAAAPISSERAVLGVARLLREDIPYTQDELILLSGFARNLADELLHLEIFQRIQDSSQLIYHTDQPNIHLVSVINSVLLEYLRSNPKELRKLPPRLYEELIAELLERDGWSTELTLPTRDGGYDIHAIRSIEGLRFSLIVEAKRWREDRPVGVAVLRELYTVKQRQHASKAMLATTSYVSGPALKEFQDVIPWELEIREFQDLIDWLKR